MKIIALLLAAMLYMSVSIETQPTTANPPGLSIGGNVTETVTDIPVVSYYDRENLVVSGVPQFVSVTLEGPNSILQTTRLQKDFEIYADLTGLGLGTHRVSLLYRNISEKLDVNIEPSAITVLIQEKISREFPVEVDFINKDRIEDGYTVNEPLVTPSIVTVTGARETVEEIALIKARVDLEAINETFKEQSTVTVYDREGNVLPVDVEPIVVDIEVPVISPSKTVPITINQNGTLKEGLTIMKMEPDLSEITIFGPKEVIEKIDSIDDLTINLDDITEDTVLKLPMPNIQGVKKVVPETISVTIDVEENVKRTYSNLPIQSVGIAEQLQIEFVDPENASLNVDVYGAQSVLDDVKAEDIQLYIDVAEYETGEYEVEIEADGPENISWELPQTKATVIITDKQ